MSKERKGFLDPKKEIPQSLIKVNSIEEVIENEIKKFDIREKDIETAIAAYGSLQIMGIDDKAGYEAVYQARVVFRNMRTAIEKRRVELKADSVKIGNAIDNEAKRLTAKFIETEKFLAGQVKAVDDEKERIKREEKEKVERERREKVESRIVRLRDIGYTWDGSYKAYRPPVEGMMHLDIVEIGEMSDDDFEALHFSQKALYNDWVIAEQKHKEEQERVRKEEELARKAEAERLAKERAELEVMAKARKLEEEQLAKKQAELDKLSEQLAENHKVISSNSHSAIPVVDGGRVPIGAIKPEDLKPDLDVIRTLQDSMVNIGKECKPNFMKDPELKKIATVAIDSLRENYLTIQNSIMLWRANQK